MKIVYIRSDNGYKSWVEGNEEIWGSGFSLRESIGDLICSHLPFFTIDEVIQFKESKLLHD